MEEAVGIRWHNWITGLAQTGYPRAAARLKDHHSRLAMVLRALGADPGLQIKPASEQRLNSPRHWLEKVAGTGLRFALAWRQHDTVFLPAHLHVFPQQTDNEALYLWLTALASLDPTCPSSPQNWLSWNQGRVLQTLIRYPGLQALYVQLVKALLLLRPADTQLNRTQRQQERLIRLALTQPGQVDELPTCQYDPLPVPLWLYPQILNNDGRNAEDVSNDETTAHPTQRHRPPQPTSKRKAAEFVEDPDGRDGLIVFRLESLFSWSEYIPLDRTLDENSEEADEASRIADDLDRISLSRQGSNSQSRIKLDLDLPSAAEDDVPLHEGILLPEWDYRRQQLQPNYCRVIPMLTPHVPPQPLPAHLQRSAQHIRDRFAALQPQQHWRKRQVTGTRLNINDYVDYCSARHHGQGNSLPALWSQRQPQQRDLSCLVLADLSLSTEAWANNEQQVIEVIQDSLHLLGEGLAASQDAFALYGFSSRRRDHVRFNVIKNFADAWGDIIHGRIQALKPGYYTRMGAAIRQATLVLQEQPSEQRLLLLLTDGKPNDLDIYESRYGLEDTREALLAAKRVGIHPFCVTIDQQAADYLPYLFGAQQYHLLRNAAELPRLLPKLYLLLSGRL